MFGAGLSTFVLTITVEVVFKTDGVFWHIRLSSLVVHHWFVAQLVGLRKLVVVKGKTKPEQKL